MSTKVAVITGAAQGIGRKTAEVLSQYGYAIALNDLRPANETAAAIENLGGRSRQILGDISREEEVHRIAAEVQTHFGRADVLVNNAGISFICPAENIARKDWQRVLDVNLTGPFLLCREFGKLMLQQGQGSIVNVSSVAGLAGISDRAAYNASKHGLIGLTRTLAAEWGGRGVRCNAVCQDGLKPKWMSPTRPGDLTPMRTLKTESRWRASLRPPTSRKPSVFWLILKKAVL